MKHSIYCQIQMLGPCTCGADAEDERDAARYRWLRGQVAGATVSFSEPVSAFKYGSAEELDAAVDRAMAAAASSPAPEQQGSGNTNGVRKD